MSEVENKVLDAKDNLPEVTPTPPPQQTPKSSAQALKERLQWGEPAFTIIDVRDRESYNDARIMGALSMPMEDLVARAMGSLEPNREIYVYGDSAEQAAQAASALRETGFERVSELSGGLSAWKEIAGATEGRKETDYEVGPAAYNLKARLDKHAEVKSKNV